MVKSKFLFTSCSQILLTCVLTLGFGSRLVLYDGRDVLRTELRTKLKFRQWKVIFVKIDLVHRHLLQFAYRKYNYKNKGAT